MWTARPEAPKVGIKERHVVWPKNSRHTIVKEFFFHPVFPIGEKAQLITGPSGLIRMDSASVNLWLRQHRQSSDLLCRWRVWIYLKEKSGGGCNNKVSRGLLRGADWPRWVGPSHGLCLPSSNCKSQEYLSVVPLLCKALLRAGSCWGSCRTCQRREPK